MYTSLFMMTTQGVITCKTLYRFWNRWLHLGVVICISDTCTIILIVAYFNEIVRNSYQMSNFTNACRFAVSCFI